MESRILHVLCAIITAQSILVEEFQIPHIRKNTIQCQCGTRNEDLETRIVGGEKANRAEFPWRVGIAIRNRYTNKTGLCGGTIISPSWILTSSHCPVNPKSDDLQIYFPHDQTNPLVKTRSPDYIAKHFYDHEEFNQTTFENDIRLIWMPPLKFNSEIRPACLPYNFKNWDFNGVLAVASGWGTTEEVQPNTKNLGNMSDVLLKVDLPVLSSEECRKESGMSYVTDNMLCTFRAGHDTCQGDSGGSIDFEYGGKFYAIGITSSGRGCGVRQPGVYTKITKYLDWIDNIIG